MIKVQLNITLTIQGPLMTQSSATGRWGLDAVVAKSSIDGRPFLPFSLVKGKLADAWKDLSEAGVPVPASCGHLLGGTATSVTGVLRPARGRLAFSDFAVAPAWREPPSRSSHRICIDNIRGSVEHGMMLVMESPFAVGERASFSGTVGYQASDETEAKQIRDWAELGLRWISSFGAERTVGFGRLLGVRVDMDSSDTVTGASMQAESTGSNTSYALVFRPRVPFCVAKRQVADNLFESDDVIPGGVIKGCLANMAAGPSTNSNGLVDPVGAAGEFVAIKRNLHLIRITHAFPAPDGAIQRPVRVPQSLVQVSVGGSGEALGKTVSELWDVAFSAEPLLIRGHAPAFSIDWKGKGYDSTGRESTLPNGGDVETAFGWARPLRELRVRTAIDRERRRAEDDKLFAYDMVTPQQKVSSPVSQGAVADSLADERPCPRSPVEWIATLDLSAVPSEERADVMAELRGLLSAGLTGLGKTKATVKAAFAATALQPRWPSRLSPVVRDNSRLWVLTLQTDALLCDPNRLDESSGAAELAAAYREVFAQLSGQTLELSHYFACQELAGGRYLQKRFASGQAAYRPYLLTNAGSVFVLRETPAGSENDGAMAEVERWLAHGLPVPAWAEDRFARNGQNGSHWDNCPYIPENGYGEIAVNLAVHEELDATQSREA
jgi:hypothetical protein